MAGMGCLEGIKRGNKYIGFVRGTIIKADSEGAKKNVLVKGRIRNVLIEDGKLILYAIGKDDMIINKTDIKSVESVAQNTPIEISGNKYLCNTYLITLENGDYGDFNIFVDHAAEFLMAIK